MFTFNMDVIEHYPTDEQIADMWTKQHGPGPFVAYRRCFMGLVPFFRSLYEAASVLFSLVSSR